MTHPGFGTRSDLSRFVAEHSVALIIPNVLSSSNIEIPHGHAGRIECEAQAFFAAAQVLFDHLAIGDVLNDAEGTDEVSKSITFGLRPLAHPADFVGDDEAILDVVGFTSQGTLACCADAITIGGVDEVKQHLETELRMRGLTQKIKGLSGTLQGIGGKNHSPIAHARHRLGTVELLFVLTQFGFGQNSPGDIVCEDRDAADTTVVEPPR